MSGRRPIDLRSDTVTVPTPAMRAAMANAAVGDDVYGEDPTIGELERRTAELLGKEEAVFVPSGTMANQIAVGAHTQPGDELLCDPFAHLYVWEAGGIARNWGVTTRTIVPRRGLLELADLAGMIRPDDSHYAKTRMVSLENTHNRAGGRVHPIDGIAEISGWSKANGLALHCDGARLMNAVVASGVAAKTWASWFDSVSICFSKGLGAPVGSALAGSEGFIQRARRLRKLLGGGMRQGGIIAAGALYALEHHVERMADDHANAKTLAAAVESVAGLSLESGPVETNLVWIAVDPAFATAPELSARLRERGVLVSALGPQVLRACTHLDVSREDVEFAAGEILKLGRR